MKITNSTLTVALICIILFGVIFLINNKGNINLNNSLQANILQTKQIKLKNNENYIKINGETYKIIIEKIDK